MISVHSPNGRLFLIRATLPMSMQIIQGFVNEFIALLSAQPGRVVSFIDLRAAPILTSEQSDFFMGLLRRDNPKIERSGFLLEPSGKAVLALQVERMCREAGNPNRKSFRDERELLTFLEETLGEEERSAIRKFIQQPKESAQ
jgi:hypothetical protein